MRKIIDYIIKLFSKILKEILLEILKYEKVREQLWQIANKRPVDLAILEHQPGFIQAVDVDIELTNVCNASCVFCPREKTPKQGFMDWNVFKRTIARLLDYNKPINIHFCGLGEPLLHPEIVEFVRYAHERGFKCNVTTNGYLLDADMSEKLINAGLDSIGISISGIGIEYEKIHKLNFDAIEKNINNLIEIAENKCEIYISITLFNENREIQDKIKNYWYKKGIRKFACFEISNRGGTLDLPYYFLKDKKYLEEARLLLKNEDISEICLIPLIFIFIGWDGNYYMCCHDYEKKYPVGHVFTHAMHLIDIIKREISGLELCKKCDHSKINKIRELLIKIEKNESSMEELKLQINEFKMNDKILGISDICKTAITRTPSRKPM